MNQAVLIKAQTPLLPLSSPARVPTIAVRKTCNPAGIGLSHYVLVNKKVAL